MSIQTKYVTEDESWQSDYLPGWRIADDEFDRLVDNGVEFIVFVDPNRGRYTTTIEDWQEHGVWDDGWTHLPRTRATRG